MKIHIILDYYNAETMTEIWAVSEDELDFRQDFFSASRCTAAFAASELKSHLEKTLPEPDISFASLNQGEGFHIDLKIEDIKSDDAGFCLEPLKEGLLINGKSRKGLLYGVYEFLRMQGWRWYAPGKAGEIPPPHMNKPDLPAMKIEYSPSMKLGRGFDFEYPSMESNELFLWMARNRLDVASYRPMTGQFCRKLGISFKNGGHVFEDILRPDRVMPTGKTLWEEHESWYGQPLDGLRKKDKALQVQFCVSQEGLMDFLGEEILERLSGKWAEADRLDIRGFDTWGSVCSCENCIKLGNGSDMMLFFLSEIRKIIDNALATGRLKHDVRLVMCIYEGTSTIKGPMNPIPANLIKSGDYGVFYPIRRCYAHDFTDSSCSINSFYMDMLGCWFKHPPFLPVMIGEYYNVSKFEDLPLLFTKRISHDIPFYSSCGISGMTYMHVPMVNWGMRTLTQSLYAQLLWDIGTDPDSFCKKYYTDWYGGQAEKAENAYELIEEAWRLSASWRAWSDQSILTQLQLWNGKKPEKPLKVNDHFITPEGAVKCGKKSLKLMNKALKIINEMLLEEQYKAKDDNSAGLSMAKNPAELRTMEIESCYENRLSEDRRLLLYGMDTMNIMTCLVEYHNAMFHKDERKVVKLWQKIIALADKMDSYFMPIGFDWPGTGLESKDALSRTQLRELLARIRSNRILALHLPVQRKSTAVRKN